MKRAFGPGIMAVAVALIAIGPARAEPPGGIGVLGDSYSDEYQFYPPDRTTARNWVEILAETRGLDFGRFSVQGRGEPRNQGFEYNWARSDATSDDMIATGQHTGVAAQAARGLVKVVYLVVGGNDFINALKSDESTASLERVLPRAIANFKTAAETVLAAHPDVRLIVGTLPDIRELPEFADPVRSGRIPAAVADAFTAAMARYNDHVRATAAANPRIALIDFAVTARLANLLDPDKVSVAGMTLDRRHPSNDLDHFFLADSRHPGTLGQGLIAQMVIGTLNVRFDAGVPPLTNEELLSYARSVSPGPRLHAFNRPTSADRAVSTADSPAAGATPIGPSAP